MSRRAAPGNPVRPRPRPRRAGSLRLVLHEGPDGRHGVVISKAVTMLGRAPANDVVIDDATVSARHARLDVGPSGPTITDLASTNGTFVDGERVTDSLGLHHGATVQLGNFTFDVEIAEPLPPERAPARPTPEHRPEERTATAGQRRVLLVADRADHEVARRVSDHLEGAGHIVRAAHGNGPEDGGAAGSWGWRLLDVVWSSDVVVFLASAASATSARARHEVHVAAAERTPVIVARAGDVDLPDDLLYYAEARSGVDLRGGGAAGLTSLALQVAATPTKRWARPRRTVLRAVSAAVAAVALVAALTVLYRLVF